MSNNICAFAQIGLEEHQVNLNTGMARTAQGQWIIVCKFAYFMCVLA